MIFSKFRWSTDLTLELTRPRKAFIYYRETRFNLLTGFPEVYPFDKFLDELSETQLQDKVKYPRVYHFHYELGLLLMGLGHVIQADTPLVIELEYETSKKVRPKKKELLLKLKSLERPSWSEYKEAFARIQTHLLEGNAYQVNLTYPFDFETEEIVDPRELIEYFFSRENLGAFAHSTFLGDELILSNSPECLFQLKGERIFTIPIKGTRVRGKDWKKAWRELSQDRKEEGELLMITDLLRNDLNRLDQPKAKVVKLKVPLLVPGLVHQCSLIEVGLTRPVSLKKVLECLFPGGSITGAPKKRVMEIIQEVERSPRGIYCGSTLLCYGDKKMASINIRTVSISIMERLWRYGAGGGITLLSQPVQEFQEMEAKVSSFLTLLKVPGYVKK